MTSVLDLLAMAEQEHTPVLVARSSVAQTHAIEMLKFPLLKIHYRYFPLVISIASLSLLATVGSFSFLTYRLIFWRKYSSTYFGYNQYIILIYNLILADMQTAGGAIITAHWARIGAIQGGSNTCIVQGWLFQEGIPASGLFVLSIAIHTFVTVILGRKLEYRTFVCCVIGVWMFTLFLTVLPILLEGKHAYVNSGAWCWITSTREDLRLGTHYIWVFLSQFGSVTIYVILFFYLRRKVALSATLSKQSQEKFSRLKRVVKLMLLYPIAYITLSLPIAASRMATAAGTKPPFTYYIIAAMIMSTSGFVHTIIYAVTRRSLILNSESTRRKGGTGYGPSSSHQGGTNSQKDVENTTCTTLVSSSTPISSPTSPIDAYKKMYHRINGSATPSPKAEAFEMDGVYQQTTISVVSRPALAPPTRDGASSITIESNTRPATSRQWPRP
ncbi:uncharacterized protein GIQ15_04936 [Arthroderma uncinatum]|uniref:uncharacterized protein n=1 Tax=Arthroderma uncinatum TaxID=74035 RepID=UPI00144A6826|nr:uncharacterized protein GIQ15_04936 [Arthroderma uncinatum]KAF3482177.1 integral membrane protein [Arthroderma uncinatum]